MADLFLNPTTGDLDVTDNALRVSEEGSESIAQRLKIRLRFFFTEWVLDRSKGTKWFEIVLKKGVDKFAADSEIRRVVLETPEIKTIENWTSNINSRTREYDVRFDVKTTEGETLSFGFRDLLNSDA
jgi:hypothetical protein